MTAPDCQKCTTPDLCLIACPNNSVLEQMKYAVFQRPVPEEPSTPPQPGTPAQPGSETPAEDDQELQVIFQEDEESD